MISPQCSLRLWLIGFQRSSWWSPEPAVSELDGCPATAAWLGLPGLPKALRFSAPTVVLKPVAIAWAFPHSCSLEIETARPHGAAAAGQKAGAGFSSAKQCRQQLRNNIWDSNVVPHRSTNQTRRCLTSLSRREAVLSSWCGRSWLWGWRLRL